MFYRAARHPVRVTPEAGLDRRLRAASAEEPKARIELYLQEVNERPVVFRWKHKLETLSAV